MKRYARRRRPDAGRGSALVPALFVVVMVAVLSMATVQLSLNKNKEAHAATAAKQAFYIAEAGIAEAFAGLAVGRSGNVASGQLPARFGDGCFWVEATDLGDDRLQLDSTGLCKTGRSAISIVVEHVSESIAALGVFADEEISIGSGCVVDSYDSRRGSYASQQILLPAGDPPPAGTRVGCNGDITVRGRTDAELASRIYGDARPGRSSALYRGDDVVITGATTPYDTEYRLPPVDVPALASHGDVDVPVLLPMRLSNVERAYGTVRVGALSTLAIVGPARVVFDTLNVERGARVTIDASAGPVQIYVRNRMELASGSTLATTAQKPSAVTLHVATPADVPVAIGSSGDFHGTIYAPTAQLSLPATLAVYGAVAARRLDVAANARIHFDRALIGAAADEAGPPRFVAWRLIDLPVAPLVAAHFDPLTVLETNALVPPKASTAHYDKGIAPPPRRPLIPFRWPLRHRWHDDD